MRFEGSDLCEIHRGTAMPTRARTLKLHRDRCCVTDLGRRVRVACAGARVRAKRRIDARRQMRRRRRLHDSRCP